MLWCHGCRVKFLIAPRLYLGLVESKFKMILLRQAFAGFFGVTAVSEKCQVTGQHLHQIFPEFGLLETADGPPVKDARSGRSWNRSEEIWFAKGVSLFPKRDLGIMTRLDQ